MQSCFIIHICSSLSFLVKDEPFENIMIYKNRSDRSDLLAVSGGEADYILTKVEKPLLESISPLILLAYKHRIAHIAPLYMIG